MIRNCRSFARKSRRAHWTLFVAVVTCALSVGCNRVTNESFTPADDSARKALTSVLDQWKAGNVTDLISGEPAIVVADTTRKPDQKLMAYQIIGELPIEGEGHRYQVQLQFADANAQQKAQYIVVGNDPLLVFRQEDYDKMAHWDMQMPAHDTESATTPGNP